MKIPSMPNVPIDMEPRFYKLLEDLKGELDEIDAVRLDKDNIHVLGAKGSFFRQFNEITANRTTGQIIEKTSFNFNLISAIPHLPLYIFKKGIIQRMINYYGKVDEYSKINLKEIEKKIKDIRVYQGTIEEVQKEMGKPLERVDTRKAETFLQGKDVFWLRVHAYLHGADAIVHYQPGSYIGTPVRYTYGKK